MTYVNRTSLPLPVFEAIKNRPYDKGDSNISMTGLNTPVRVKRMMDELGDSLEIEASDSLYALDGSAMHAILEWAGKTLDPERYILERRLFAEVDGWKVSGQIDVMDLQEGLIQDYKKTSYWVAIYGAKEEWTRQLNGYRWLAHKNGIKIDKLEVWANFRDWKKESSWRDPKYPKAGHKIIPITVLPLEETERYIKERVKAHKEGALIPSASMPKCSDEEVWSKKSWAVLTRGNERAKKVESTKREALDWAAANLKPEDLASMVLEERAGDPRRCIGYCPVRFHCEYGKGVARK